MRPAGIAEVYGGDRIISPLHAGFSLAGGFWMNEERTRGLDASLFYLSGVGSNSLIFSKGDGLLLPTAAGTFPLAVLVTNLRWRM